MHTKVKEALQIISEDRHKLILVVGSFASGKSGLLMDLAAELNGRYVNLNLELSERLLALPRSSYADGVTVHLLIDRLCDEFSPSAQPLFIDNIELLFSPEVGKINPLDTFKRISRQRPVVLSLLGVHAGEYVEYSQLGRQDYLRMPLEDYIVIDMVKRS